MFISIPVDYQSFCLGFLWFWSGDSGEDFINDNIAGKQLFRERIDELWDALIGGSGVWTQIVNISALIGFVFLAWNLLQLFKNALDNEPLYKIFDKVILIGIILIFLGNNGALAAELARANRDLIIGFDNGIALALQVDTQYNQKLRELVGKSEARSLLQTANQQCGNLALTDPPKYKQCLNDYLVKVQNRVEASAENQGFLAELGKIIADIASDTLDLGAYIIQTATFTDDRIKLFAASLSYRIFADIGLIITALTLPFALASSLAPGGIKAIYGWFSTVYGIGLSIISFTLVIGILSSILTSGDGIDDFILGFLLGKAVPIFSTAIGGGGGFILFSTLNSSGLEAAGKLGITRTLQAIFK